MKKVLFPSLLFVGCCAVVTWFVLLFHGSLDGGKFQIVQSQPLSPHKIAIVAQRSSTQALSGNEFFIIIADHIYSPEELKRALHSSQPIFIADRDGLQIRWDGPNMLIIKCNDCDITQDRIQTQRFRDQDITVRYDGFPKKT